MDQVISKKLENLTGDMRSPESLANYTVYDFERIDVTYWRGIFRNNWHISWYISAVYLILVFGGRYLMRNRQPFSLRKPLIFWNLGLAAFSLWGTIRSAPEFFHTLGKPNGIYHLVCSRELEYSGYALWYILFNLSKPIELGDTLFIVLRKQPLIFLHYYHHISVMVLNWYIVSFWCPLTRLFTMMNYTVHTAMYSYYGLKAAKFRIPKIISMMITLMQIVQMFFGLISTIYLHWNIEVKKTPCDTELSEALMGYVVYCPYLILFLIFFFKTYFGKKKSKKE